MDTPSEGPLAAELGVLASPAPLPEVEISEACQASVAAIAGRVSRRSKGALVRNSFVRRSGENAPPPLTTMSQTKGRGAGVPIKLYLGLLWLSAKNPFDSDLEAKRWAQVLDLPEPEGKGARRVRDGLDRLSELKLIRLERSPGAASKVFLLREDGSGTPYKLPHSDSRGRKVPPEDMYFKIPPALWTSGQIQNMSSAALIMLLIVLEESRGKTEPQWWSTKMFEDRFDISKDVRARGTAELEARSLLRVRRAQLTRWPGSSNPLEPMRTRKSYAVINEAAGKERASAQLASV
jgi:hypothetical protein